MHELSIVRKMGLGDNFLRKLLFVKKSVLGVGLIEPKNVIDYLAIKLHVGKKRSKGELTTTTNTHEEISEDDSGITIRVRRKKGKFKHQKVGWIEEIEHELRERKIEIIDDEEE